MVLMVAVVVVEETEDEDEEKDDVDGREGPAGRGRTRAFGANLFFDLLTTELMVN